MRTARIVIRLWRTLILIAGVGLVVGGIEGMLLWVLDAPFFFDTSFSIRAWLGVSLWVLLLIFPAGWRFIWEEAP